jgi:hypothetical protein
MDSQSIERRDPRFGSKTNESGESTVLQLLRRLGSEISDLLSKEVSLARFEAHTVVQDAKSGMTVLMTGCAILAAGLVVLLMSAVYWLSTTTVLQLWSSALLVGAPTTSAGLIMFLIGKSKLKVKALKPRRTIDTLKQDGELIKGVVQ